MDKGTSLEYRWPRLSPGYDQNDPVGRGSESNSPNGTRSKTVFT
ncbi:hypothetical protein [Mycobacterium cookii]|nr:hypothetical protein [Mycobacterium cookii]